MRFKNSFFEDILIKFCKQENQETLQNNLILIQSLEGFNLATNPTFFEVSVILSTSQIQISNQ